MSIEVRLKRNENIDGALRKLKKKMASEGILKSIKDRKYFKKPSEMKREKSAQARSRRAKEERMKNKGIM